MVRFVIFLTQSIRDWKDHILLRISNQMDAPAHRTISDIITSTLHAISTIGITPTKFHLPELGQEGVKLTEYSEEISKKYLGCREPLVLQSGDMVTCIGVELESGEKATLVLTLPSNQQISGRGSRKPGVGLVIKEEIYKASETLADAEMTLEQAIDAIIKVWSEEYPVLEALSEIDISMEEKLDKAFFLIDLSEDLGDGRKTNT